MQRRNTLGTTPITVWLPMELRFFSWPFCSPAQAGSLEPEKLRGEWVQKSWGGREEPTSCLGTLAPALSQRSFSERSEEVWRETL